MATGQVMVVIGPSGSGKSTLLRCIARLEPIQRGRILIDGVLASRGTEEDGPGADAAALRGLRHDVGMVFQSFNLFPHLTVLRERHPRAAPRPRAGAGRGRRPGDGAAAARRARRQARRLPGAALRRPAAARRDRPRARHAAAHHALRRGHLRARPRAGRRGAEDDARARRARHDHARRDPRDGLRVATSPTTSSSWTTAPSSSARRPTRCSSSRRKPRTRAFLERLLEREGGARRLR